jgi:cell division protein FtsQ
MATVWLSVAVCTVVLLVAAINKSDAAKCKKVVVDINGVSTEEKFVDEKDVLVTLQAICKRNPIGMAVGAVDLQTIETALKKSAWIKSANLFFDNEGVLQVKIYEREPVARLFAVTGTSFYIDSAKKILPLSDKFSARLPVFTGFPADNIVLSAADSNLLAGVKSISIAIQKDSFLMAMIEQIDITPGRSFEMVPKIGRQVIVFGDATDIDSKFEKLRLFYKNIISKSGWSKYSVINLQYKNQVVAKIRGAEDKTADSVRTLQLMQVIAANAARMAEDSLQTIRADNSSNTADSSMIQQSIQRDDNTQAQNRTTSEPLQPAINEAAAMQPTANPLPSAKPNVPASENPEPIIPKPVPPKPKPAAPAVAKPKPSPNPVAKPPTPKPNTPKPKPKAAMPPSNDYNPIP